MYKELRTAHKTPPIRHFFRSFVIVPAESGLCIVNEQLHVTNATEEQARVIKKIIKANKYYLINNFIARF